MICICWAGLTQYGARIVGAFVEQSHEDVIVVATRPRMPIKKIDQYAQCRVIWIENDERRSLKTMLGQVPATLLVGGWFVSVFNRFRDEVHECGGRVYAMVDNNYQLDCKVIANMLRFRFLLKKRYDGFLVPGESGRRLLRFYGVPASRIARGLYSADETQFKMGRPLLQREKKVLYVGQFIERKNVVRMCRAFMAANAMTGGEWKLELCGKGPLQDALPIDESIIVHDFIQPEDLPEKYQDARIFVLPSLEEHWGLVVHEAALSGCALLLSDRVGAMPDLLGEKNGCSFPPSSTVKLKERFVEMMTWTDTDWDLAYHESLILGKSISRKDFSNGVNRLMGKD